MAANQVGILRRMVVIDLGDRVIKLVTPVIIQKQGEQFEAEGRLIFPAVWGKVRRPQMVRVKALNENGISIEYEGGGLLAKCFCHEIDHLDGILFVDKAEQIVRR